MKVLLVVLILEIFILVSMVNGTEIVGKNLVFYAILIINFILVIYYYDINVNKCGVKCGTSLRFWEQKGWINGIDPYGWFQWYCRYFYGRRCDDDLRQINRYKKIVNRFKDILVKMIKNTGAKFDDTSISPKIRQILLHWGYELVDDDII